MWIRARWALPRGVPRDLLLTSAPAGHLLSRV